MNLIELTGRLTKDVEIYKTQKDYSIAHFTLAVNDYDSGKREEYKSYFFDCKLFGKRADVLAKYCKKGDQINVYGKLIQRKYTNKDGQEVKKIEIECDGFDLLGSKKSSTTETTNKANEPVEDLTDEDLPF